MRAEEKRREKAVVGRKKKRRRKKGKSGRKMREEERQVGRGERKGTWLEINRNVTIFHQTRAPPSLRLLLRSPLCERASGVHSEAEHRENGGRELEWGGRGVEERFCRWLCVHAVGKRSGARADTRVYPPSGRCLAWMKKSRG